MIETKGREGIYQSPVIGRSIHATRGEIFDQFVHIHGGIGWCNQL